MLGVVYCSDKRDLELEKGLIESAGLKEIKIYHYKDQSFSKAYNKALFECPHDIILFIRHDVRLHTKDWGQKLLDNFKSSNYGILGVVGSVIVPMSGLVWEKDEPLVGRIWYETFDKHHEQKFSEIFNGKIIPVACLDDSFFAIDKTKILKEFDTDFEKDAFYDLDFFIKNYQEKVKIGVIFDIKVLKLQLNPQDEEWVNARTLFIKKQKMLPIRIKPEILISNQHVKIENPPKISVLIPSKGKIVELASCLESIYEHSPYSDMEIFILDLGSSEDDLFAIRDFIQMHQNTKLIEMKHEHLPTCFEEAIDHHIDKNSELLLFVHPDVIFLNDMISKMVKVYQEEKDTVGTLGCRMHTRNNMIRHFGLQLISTLSDEGYELGLGYQGFQTAYKYQNKVVKGVLGSSRDLLMIQKDLYKELGGFDKEYMHSLEDFDLNIKAILKGRKNILVGTAVCYFLGQDMPKFLPTDFEKLIAFVNQNVENITPYVDLLSAA
jgi:GT2 family glycosyltransferase